MKMGMKVGILGAGNVGSALGRRFSEAGHTVFFGVPDPKQDKYRKLVESISSNARVGTPPEAGRFGEVIVLATPWNAAPAALTSAGSLSGKIVIDCTNPLNPDYSGLSVGFTDSAGEQVARWAKDAKICKAFNHTGAQNMANPVFRGGRPAMFVCGDDEASRKTVLDLAGSIGFDPVDAGPLSSARLLEPLAMLWIHLAYGMKLGPDLAFGLLRR